MLRFCSLLFLGLGCTPAATPAKATCAAYLDAPSRPHEQPDAILTLSLDDGATGYEHELLAQVLPDGGVRAVSIRMSEPGSNGGRASYDAIVHATLGVLPARGTL